jgi:hypothetical protein
VAILALLISLIPAVVYAARTGGGSDDSVLADLWPGLIVASVLLVALVWASGWSRHVGLVRARVGWWRWYALPSVWAFGLLVLGRLSHWGEPEPFPLVGLILVLLLVGFTEELTFRGFVLHLFRTRMPLGIAVAAVSALFALLHTGTGESAASIIATIVAVFSLAVLQAALYVAGGSLIPVIAFHVWWDLMIFSGGGIDLGSDATALAWGGFAATIIMTLGYGTYLLIQHAPQEPLTTRTPPVAPTP